MGKQIVSIEIELPFNGPAFSEAWDEWIRYRNERRLPKYVPTGLKKTFAALIRDSGGNEQTAIAIINNSIEKNWQGLFPIKHQPNGADSKPTSTSNKQQRVKQFYEKGLAAYQQLAAGRAGNDEPKV